MLKNGKLAEIINGFSAPNGPGLQYVVVNNDSIIYEKCIGLADISNNILLTLDHTMSAFSMTKTLTAIAVLQLVEKHLVKLDDKITSYFEHPYDSEITVRQLLNHTSGIPNPIPLKWAHLSTNHFNFDEQVELSQVLEDNSVSKSKPGEKYRYSNIGYWLLGRLIEKVSKKEYTNYVIENIFEPLALTPDEIGFLIMDENNHAKGYLKKWSFMNLFGRFFIDRSVLGDYEGSWLHIKNVYVNGPSFGGAIGSAKAFSRILQDLLSEKSKLLKEETRQLLYSQQKTNSDKKIDMTLGWHIDKLNGITYYFKEGGGAGFHSEMRIYPERKLASVLMTNRTSFHSRKILSELDINFVAN
jgi:D-alanyl-D-alanine carboxypeptidase